MGDLFWLYPLPLLAALIIIFIFGDQLQEKSGLIGAVGSGLVFILSITLAPAVFSGDKLVYSFQWFPGVNLGFRIDGLSWIMLIVVTFLVSLILLYSYSYMEHEKGLRRFFSFMVLFGFSMVQLIVADNLLQLFIAWEIMGLCSYSLIGFYFEKSSAASAGKKAFLTTKVGDVFMLLGILVLYAATDSFNYDEIFSAASSGLISLSEIALATLFIFGGVVGKSAQFPLHIWLPDAMEGPTPVSALIHAAAMVKAGMYLMIRLYPLYEVSEFTLKIIMIVGTITVLFAALMAIFADDFKQVLAFSTISQLGYMTVALGCLGAFPALLHVINHAFFKALLFLGAGSVIHSVGTGDIRKMGGVFKYQKITGSAMLLGTLSIAGIPGFSGFVSKDEILLQVYEHGSLFSYYILLLTGMLTAFYMFRLYFMVFTREKRSDYHGHESPVSMLIPLVLLGIAAVFSGRLKNPLMGLLNITETAHHNNIVVYSSVAAALIGIVGALLIYYLKIIDIKNYDSVISGPKKFFQNRYYFDYFVEEIICKYFVKISGMITMAIERWIFDGIVIFAAKSIKIISNYTKVADQYIVDGFVNKTAAITKTFSGISNFIDIYIFDGAVRFIEIVTVRKGEIMLYWNNGKIQTYLLWTVVGIILIVSLIGGVF